MKSICLINVFFGGFPWYFDFFLKSCGLNPTINFLIFTDNAAPKSSPENVTFISFTLEEFNKVASDKLGMKIEIGHAYKLCDFKPAYGVIFSDYLKDFEFWGITDIDIVFGRIREFMTEELITEYEVISVRNDYPTGSFMLFKNEENINNLFRKSKDYITVFTSEKHYCFDECAFEHLFLEQGGNIFDIKTDIESMHHVLMKEMLQNDLKVHFDFLIIEGLPGKLYWDNGLLSFKNEFEVLHYHLILYKDNQYTLKEIWTNIPDQFYIAKYMFYRKGLLHKLNYFYYEKVRICFLKKLIIVENFISTRSNKSILKSIENSLYISGKYKRYLTADENGFARLSFSELHDGYKLYKSFFRKNVLFLKSNSDIHYKLRKENDLLIEVTADGSSFKLTRS